MSRPKTDPLDVLVTCHPHAQALEYFPQVRGYYLARHLARSGLRAEFRQLPVPDVECDVLICSEYQNTADWFRRHLARPLAQIRSRRAYCLAEGPLGREPHFSRTHCEWFARRGGVLFQLLGARRPAPHEHYIGIGVDPDVIPPPDGSPDAVVFDFPRSNRKDAASDFDPSILIAVRARMPDCRLVGTGPADAVVRPLFDEWVEYGQPHARYVRRALRSAFAVVPGWNESMGLFIAEAQVAGACIVASNRRVKPSMIVSGASVWYDQRDGDSLADAVLEARHRRHEEIATEARRRFDPSRMVARTRSAISL